MGSKRAHFTCLGTPNGLEAFLGKHIFDPFWTHFLSQNSPFSRHLGILGGPKQATTSSKRAKNTCFGIPCGPRSFLKKVIFLHLVDVVDPFWHPPLWATSCSLTQPTGPRYGGLGVGSGNFEGWKPPKVGGSGWIRCARNQIFACGADFLQIFAQRQLCRYRLVYAPRPPMLVGGRCQGGLLVLAWMPSRPTLTTGPAGWVLGIV